MKEQITFIDTEGMERPSAEMDYNQVRRTIYQQTTKVIVIVQAYGKIEKTKRCVENILRYTKDIPFELWLLDNGSEENDILEFFKSVDYEPKKIIRITKNITGVFAVNRLIHQLTSEYFAIVNNDIIVTKNWLKNLITCMDSDPKIGAACPVSTNISNNQLEVLEGFSDLEEMQEKAARFNKSDKRKWEERLRIIPTAMLFRREMLDDIGVFDVGFVHDFGDDDFFFRARRAGYQLIVCRDTFVHHDHNIMERDISGLEMKRGQMGREAFQKKYQGLDAWEDGANHIKEFCHYSELDYEKEKQIQILGVDTRCGTPILDVKNKLKAEGYFDFMIDAFTTDLKYYFDLNSISDYVVHDNISTVISRFRDKKYQFIVLGEALNSYQKPVEVLLDLMSLTASKGILLFHIYNTDNIYEFLWQQGLINERISKNYQRISYDDIINELKEIPLKKLDIDLQEYPVTDEIRNFTDQMAFISLEEGREERVQNLYVMDYWFWVQKD